MILSNFAEFVILPALSGHRPEGSDLRISIKEGDTFGPDCDVVLGAPPPGYRTICNLDDFDPEQGIDGIYNDLSLKLAPQQKGGRGRGR